MSRRLVVAAVFAIGAACSAPARKPKTTIELGDTHVQRPPPQQPQEVTLVAQPDSPLPLDQDLPRLAARWLAMYQELARTLAASGADCAGATAKLGELRTRYADVASANAAVIADGRGPQLHAAYVPLDPQVTTAANAITSSPAVGACATDAGFTTALDQLVEGRP